MTRNTEISLSYLKIKNQLVKEKSKESVSEEEK